ncbi:hypothetical protein LCGC14_1588730 [marine sediment metagenome]|uniref:Uncharacterized protein n=1 Tax=marine sediment metagenome TaxID=412755 RepID=A0A0F9IEP1_9ZZZZ
MENYGYRGGISPNRHSIGTFTIYNWGFGAASEAFNRVVDNFGKDFIFKN